MLALTAALAASILLFPVQAEKEVFAHYILGNAAPLEVADWEQDIQLAQDSKIDGFVLNVAPADSNNAQSLSRAFEAAETKNFSLFFSFDYLAQGPWPKDDLIALMKEFSAKPPYFKQGDKPVASTFEGPANADDWPDIKTQTNCFFVPDWSSISPADAVGKANGVVDGLFSFDAWPVGATNKTTDKDKDFQTALGQDKVYMMPVSPWFSTALPGLNKNWLWRGDNLWETRWKQVLEIQPQFVEILTWNDYGESHYIGPIGPVQQGPAKDLMVSGQAPVDYVTNNAHDGWRKHLPFYIDLYKSSATSLATPADNADIEESVVAYYRTNPATACQAGGTTGDNADFGPLHVEIAPDQMVEDSVFFTALLKEAAEVEVSIGGKVDQNAVFTSVPEGGSGIYEGSVSFAANTGDVVVTVKRDGNTVAEAKGGAAISGTCTAENWNAVAVSS